MRFSRRYEHAVLTPPATLIEQALMEEKGGQPVNSTSSPALRFASTSYKTLRGVIELGWSVPSKSGGGGNSTCGIGNEDTDFKLGCPGSTIASVVYASYGTPSGDCAHGFKDGSCASNTTKDLVAKCCVGKETCDFSISGAVSTCDGKDTPVSDPCYGMCPDCPHVRFSSVVSCFSLCFFRRRQHANRHHQWKY